MNLLQTAVKARLPLIAVKTDDPRYLPMIVTAITGEEVQIVRELKRATPLHPKAKVSGYLNKGQLGIAEWTEGNDWKEIGTWCEEHGCTLIVVNPQEKHPWFYEISNIPVPSALVKEFVEELTAEDPIPLMNALSGLSYTSMTRVVAMATAEFGEFTPKTVRATRKKMFPAVRGLEEVATDQLFYSPPERIVKWLEVEGRLFKQPKTHPLLVPRGFLFKGPPGTGKSSGAKYLAEELKVPLYKLDVGTILGKYIGESDERLRAALDQADSFEPCVLLLDEVEKLFEIDDSSGVISRLLGYTLWWLQEHQSRVLVVLTTNDDSKIPPELYRPGRTDEVVDFAGLNPEMLIGFIFDLAEELSPIAVVPTEDLEALAADLGKVQIDADGHHYYHPISQARVTEQVLRLIKIQTVKKQENLQ